jgi:hypothetical protein
MDTAIELDFADGRYRFWLPMPQIVALERGPSNNPYPGAYPRSVFAMYEAMASGVAEDDEGPKFLSNVSAFASDVIETIRLGLIGGNLGVVNGEEVEVGPILAGRLVREYAYPARPLEESLYVAWAILHAAIRGIQLKKKGEAPAKPRPKRSVKAK